jgi:hypothetical protein
VFDLTGPDGGTWTLDLDRREIARGADKTRPARLEMRLPSSLFEELLLGKADLSRALTAGELSFSGAPEALLDLSVLCG